MAVRFSAANQRLNGAGPAGTVATVLGWFYLVNDRNDFSNIWVLHNGTEATPEAGLGTDVDGTTLTAYDAAFTSTGSFALSTGTWYRHAVVMDGTAWTAYVGAAGGALSSSSGTRTAISSPTTLTLSSAGDWTDGRQAAVKVYTAALTEAELELEWSQYQPVRTANLQRYHPFVNAELVDYSGGGLTLTAGAGATTTEPGPPIRWDARLLEQLYRTPSASAETDADAEAAAVGVVGNDSTVTRTAEPLPTAAAVGALALDATIDTGVQVAAGFATLLMADDLVTALVSPSVGAGVVTVEADDADATTAATNASAEAAAVAVVSDGATVTHPAQSASLSMVAHQAMVINGTSPDAVAAAVGMAANAASISILVGGGLASVGIAAEGVISGNLALACANLSTTVVVDQLFAVVSYADRHEAVVTQDEHTSTVGVEEHYSVTSICGRG